MLQKGACHSMNKSNIQREIHDLEERFSDGIYESCLYWSILVYELGMLYKKYPCNECTQESVKLFEKLEKTIKNKI